jgi:hypothetical protein
MADQPFETLARILKGEYTIKNGGEFYNLPRFQQRMTECEEIDVWNQYEAWQRQIMPKCKFTPKGIANIHERNRRWVLFAMFKLFHFRSQNLRIQSIFQKCIGRVSLQWMAFCVGTDAPPFYYEWFLQSQPKNLTTWGEVVYKQLAGSSEHLEFLKKIRSKQVDKWIVNEVMKT